MEETHEAANSASHLFASIVAVPVVGAYDRSWATRSLNLKTSVT